MKSFTFFLVLFISITLIYLVLYKISELESDSQLQVQNEMEHFTVNSNSIQSAKNSIMSRLGISENRIHNYKESGDVNDTNEFKIEFEIYPRNLSDKKQPSIVEIETILNDMINNKDIFKIQSSSGQNVYIGKIKVDSINLNKNNEKQKEDKKEEDGYINPSIDYQMNYLKYLKSGIHNETSIQPRYKFNNLGKLELEQIPTPSSKPSLTPKPKKK
jgi:hypothetical protein